MREQVVDLLEKNLFRREAGWLSGVYASMTEKVDDPEGFKLENIEPGHTVFEEFLSDKKISNLGIDLPVWFGDPEKAKQRLMIVAMDPKRHGQTGRSISLNSVFSLHSRPNGRETGRNDYWRFIKPFTDNALVYLTDVYKLYYNTVTTEGDRTHVIASNKDETFIGRTTGTYGINKTILAQEIKAVRPTRIVAFGNEAAAALINIQQIGGSGPHRHEHGMEYIFMPHISRTVTQSIGTIANLYETAGILRGNEELRRVGEAIRKHRSALYGEG